MNKGDRVGAVLSASKGTVHYLGDGTYLGDLQPPVGPFGMTRDDATQLWVSMGATDEEIHGMLSNPCIQLDSGRYVWGFQCWWGSIDVIKERFDGWEFVDAEVDTYYDPLDEDSVNDLT